MLVQVCDACVQRYTPLGGNKAEIIPADGDLKREDNSDTVHPCCPLCFNLLSPSSACITNKTVKVVLEKPLLTPDMLKDGGLANPAATHPAEIASLSLESAVLQLKSEWTFEEFTVDLSLPAAFAVREKAAKWLLSDSCAPISPSSTKDTLRSLLISQIEGISGAVFNPCASFKVQIKCEYEEEIDSEAEWLHGGVKKKSKKRKNRSHWNGSKEEKLPQMVGNGGANIIAKDYSLLSSAATVLRLDEMSKDEFLQRCPLPVSSLSRPCTSNGVTLLIKGHRSPQYIGGRYLKVQRGLPQSPWVVGGVRKGETSVQEELAAAILPGAKADSYAFISSGREDIDVRMLGCGRPFALEVRNARVWPIPCQDLPSVTYGQFTRAHCNSGVYFALKSAQLTPENVTHLKMGEENKKKSYTAVCWASNCVDSHVLCNRLPQSEFEIRQKTPLRVLHRRPNLDRCRIIHQLSAKVLPGRPDGYFLLRLTTAAGTYVKEFINGDRGRTRPSLSDMLGCRVECVYLDVTAVHMEF